MNVRRIPGVVLFVAALAACGGGAESATTEPAGAATSVVATSPQPEPEPTTTLPGGASSSGGEQPTLQWGAVDGAALYSVVVSAPDGSAYWGWQGPDTTVTVGEGAPSPLVRDDMTWTVIAYDDAGDVVWESGPLPI